MTGALEPGAIFRPLGRRDAVVTRVTADRIYFRYTTPRGLSGTERNVPRPVRAEYRGYLRTLSDDEFENERYTLRNESRFLDLSDDEIADRLDDCDADASRRSAS